MKSSMNTKNVEDIIDKLSPVIEIIEFNNPVEITCNGENLYITEIEQIPEFENKVIS
jgi:predicted transcriptional regulator